jgi:hypothetical protein
MHCPRVILVPLDYRTDTDPHLFKGKAYQWQLDRDSRAETSWFTVVVASTPPAALVFLAFKGSIGELL